MLKMSHKLLNLTWLGSSSFLKSILKSHMTIILLKMQILLFEISDRSIKKVINTRVVRVPVNAN